MMTPSYRNTVRVVLILALSLYASRTPGQESEGFSMDRLTLSAVSGEATSSSFALQVTAAEISPVGSASFCNNGFVASAGFWSFRGSSPVPLVLSVSRDVTDPGAAVLSWSGAAPEFRVHRSLAPDDVLDATNLMTTTPDCSTVDPQPVAADGVFFYLVVPSSP